MVEEENAAAETPPRIGRRSWRSAVLQAESDLERLAPTRFDVLLGLRRQVQQYMSDFMDGRTFGRGEVDVLWASEISADLTNFLQATEKSTFVSEHQDRWPGIVSLYCEAFVRGVGMLSRVDAATYAAFLDSQVVEPVNGALA